MRSTWHAGGRNLTVGNLLQVFARREGAAPLVAGIVLLLLCPIGARVAQAAIVPPPCGVPGTPACPTTTTTSTSTTTLAPIPSPPQTTTTSIALSTSPPSTPEVTAPPTAPAASTEPPVTAQDVSPTTTESAQQQLSAPLIVDPDEPDGQPPLIVATGATCSAANVPNGQAWATVLNVDAHHYPANGPFLAYYDWVFTQGATEIATGTVKTAADSDAHTVVSPDQLAPGPYLVTITDRYLGLAASAEIVVGDCADAPLPGPLPLSPVAAIPAMECAEETDGGRAWIAVQNPPGDDGSERSYTVQVKQGSNVVWTTAFGGPVADGSWSVLVVVIDAGTYDIVTVDDQDPALNTTVALVMPPCPADAPASPTDPPLLAPTITVDPACIAAPEVSATVSVELTNNHFDQFGGAVATMYEVVVGDGNGGVYNSFDVDLVTPGATYFKPAGNLAPGVYVATIAHTVFPDVAVSVTFQVEECTQQIPQPEPPQPLTLGDIQLMCLPGDATETLVFTVVNNGFTNHEYQWLVIDAQAELSGLDEMLGAGSARLHVVRPLVAGDVAVTVQPENDPADMLSQTVTVAPCAGEPVEPVEPTMPAESSMPADPGQPVDPSMPVDPGQPDDPVEPTMPVDPSQPLDPSVPGGSLPATRFAFVDAVDAI